MTDVQIVNKLNEEGLITNKSNKFTIDSIKWIRYKHKIPCIALQKPEELSINQVAEKFNVSHYVIRYWIEHKLINARRIGQKFWISMGLEQESELQKITSNSTKIAIARLKTQEKIARGVL